MREAELWAITAYFNPAGYRRRRENFRRFRQRLAVPLVAVELGFGPDFELGPDDAEILVQIRGGDVMWQKERLLNIALKALPSSCRTVAWLDCDVIFEREDWWRRATEELERTPVVQLFSSLSLMPRDAPAHHLRSEDAEARLQALTVAVRSGRAAQECLAETRIGSAHAYSASPAWAIRRDLLTTFGFYDACIVGGGDTALVSAFHGCFDHVLDRHRMNASRSEHYLNWARPVAEAVAGDIAFIEGEAFHLWHGNIDDRHYASRHMELSGFAFDPWTDIAAEDGSPWQWSSDKHAMHGYVASYFNSRREDG
jgi:hypothetical protein